MKSATSTLIKAMRLLARDIQSEDHIANMAIAEAADRLEEQEALISKMDAAIQGLVDLADSPTPMSDSEVEERVESARALLEKNT